jgi:hypothetical protein
MTKIAGSGYRRHGSADPDPHKNVLEPQHCFNFPFIGSVGYGLVECRQLCYGSVTFLCGCGSSDPFTGLRIRIWIPVLLFSSAGLKMRTENKFFFLSFFCLFLTASTVATFSSVFKDKKLLRSHTTIEIKVFLNFLHVDGRIQSLIRTNSYESGSGRHKNLRSIVSHH